MVCIIEQLVVFGPIEATAVHAYAPSLLRSDGLFVASTR